MCDEETKIIYIYTFLTISISYFLIDRENIKLSNTIYIYK